MSAVRSTTGRELAREVWRLLMQAIMSDRRDRFDQVASRTNLSMSQAHAVMELNPDGRPASMRALAACLHNDPSNITGLVDRLEAKGLVERRADPADRRVKALVLTNAGRRARAKLQEIIDEPPATLTRLTSAQLRAMRDMLIGLIEGDTR